MVDQNEHVDALIFAELDGTLEAAESKTIALHVLQCSRCASLRMEQRALQLSLAGPPLTSMDLDRGHDLVWRRLAQPRVAPAGGFWRGGWGGVVLAATVALVAAVALGFGVAQSAARPDLGTAVVVQSDVVLAGATGTLTVTERPRTDGARQVVVTTDLRLSPPPTDGVLEIRVRRAGESYGILAAAPVLTGVSRVHIGGAFPSEPAVSGERYFIWVHLETDGVTQDSTPIPLRITSDRIGVHARPG